MTDYDRHARILDGNELAIVSTLGSHDIGTREAAPRGTRQTREVYDIRTGEPIAVLGRAEAIAFARWLETERPLPERPPIAYVNRDRWIAFALDEDRPLILPHTPRHPYAGRRYG